MKKPGEIPATWVWTELKLIGEIVSGGTPSTKIASYWGGKINWISPADLSNYTKKNICKGAKSITKDGLDNSSAKVMPAGSVHFSSRAPIGYVAISAKPMATNQGFKSIVPHNGMYNAYIYYYLKASKQLADKVATGTTFREISGTAFGKLPIPVAPCKEQHRIVAKIEELFSELDRGVESLKKAREQLKIYRQALLKHAFEGKLTEQWRRENADKLETADQLLERIKKEREGRYQQQLDEWEAEVKLWEDGGKEGRKPLRPRKPKEISISKQKKGNNLKLPVSNWLWVRLSDVSAITGGLTKNAKRSVLDNKMPYLRVANVYADQLNLNEVKTIGVKPHEIDKVSLKKGDLLVVEGNGSIDQIGRVAVWGGEIEPCLHQNHLIKARLLPCVHPRFALHFFLSKQGRNLIVNEASSTSGLHTLSLRKVENLLMPIPSYAEQVKTLSLIDEKLSSIEQINNDLTVTLSKSEALRQSILKKAFSGQLVPQDPDDEPAAALLERIAREKAAAKAKTSKTKKAPKK